MLRNWIDNEDSVLLIIDANEALTKKRERYFRHTMEMIELHELIFAKHPRLKPPPTRYPGSYTINIMFGTPVLNIVRGGYAPYVEYTDHRLSWVDIRWDSVLRLFQKLQQLFVKI